MGQSIDAKLFYGVCLDPGEHCEYDVQPRWLLGCLYRNPHQARWQRNMRLTGNW